MRTTLNAQEKPLHKVFCDDYIFTIPAVQRPYSWTTEEAGELLDDLIEFIKHYGITEDSLNEVEEPYFLGSIVLVKGDGPKSEVLDGQQRLTTLTILLACLRDYLSEEYANEIDSLIVQKGSRIRNVSDTFRMELRSRDNDFFRKVIQTKGAVNSLNENIQYKTDSQRAIRDNAIYYMERFNDIDEHIIKTLPGVIATLCYIVVVSTPNFDSAFRIFTVLNDRGLDLMPCDIFKARIIGDINESEQENYTNKWEEVEVSLGRERFNKLFDHMRMIIQKRKGSVNYKEEYEEILSTIKGKNFIDEYLIPYSEIYLKLVDYRTHFNDNPKLIKVLSLLNRIDNVDWFPAAMLYIKKYNDHHLYEFLVKLEIFAGTSMVLRKNFNWRQSRYSLTLKDIDNDEVLTYKNLEIKEEDKAVLIEKINGNVYTDLKDTAKRYVLLKLDSMLTNGQPYYDYKTITVEHVLPQNPKANSEWLINFINPEEYVHKLGNLVLLTRAKNSQARNYDFDKKKTTYFQTRNGVNTFALTNQVINENQWTPKELNKRQRILVELLIKAWKLSN